MVRVRSLKLSIQEKDAEKCKQKYSRERSIFLPQALENEIKLARVLYYIVYMPEITDEEIAQKVQRGDTDAFGILVERYEDKMLRYARRFLFGYEDGEDAVQGVFLRSYINIKQFDTTKKFSSWLYRIAHNEFINVIKKKGKESLPLFEVDTLFPHLVAQEDSAKDFEQKELKEMLEKHLQKISPKYREILVLYYFEQLGYTEIAEILKIPPSTVGVRLKRAKDSLKKIISSQNIEYGK